MPTCSYCAKPVSVIVYQTTPENKELQGSYRSSNPEVYCDAVCSTRRYEALDPKAPQPSDVQCHESD